LFLFLLVNPSAGEGLAGHLENLSSYLSQNPKSIEHIRANPATLAHHSQQDMLGANGGTSLPLSPVLQSYLDRSFAQPVEFLWIDYCVDLTNPPSLDLTYQDPTGMPIQVANDGWPAVDLFNASLYAGKEAQTVCCSTSHFVGAVNGFACNRHLATAVANEHDIIGQQRKQSLHIPTRAGTQELLGQACLLLARYVKARAALIQMSVGAVQNLAAIDLAFAHDLGYVSIVILEDLAQQEHPPFEWPQSLQQQPVNTGLLCLFYTIGSGSLSNHLWKMGSLSLPLVLLVLRRWSYSSKKESPKDHHRTPGAVVSERPWRIK
jgi:hypothetical protein